MKKVALYGSLLALFGATAAFGAGQFPGYPLATSSPTSGNATTLPLTGNETIPADTNLTQSYNGLTVGSIQPQTEVIQTSQLKAYVLTSPTVTGNLSIAASLPTVSTCGTSPTVAAGSNANGGTITTGSTATTACTITFATPFATSAACSVSPVGAANSGLYVSAQSASALTLTYTSATSQKFAYTCIGN